MSDEVRPIHVAAVALGALVALIGLASILSFADHLLYLSDRDATSDPAAT